MTFSPLEILQAGADTRNGTDLELFMQVEDALTPKCGHSEHLTRTDRHGGEVHRLVRCEHPCAINREAYLCDKFWVASVMQGFLCATCEKEMGPADYTVLAVF